MIFTCKAYPKGMKQASASCWLRGDTKSAERDVRQEVLR